MNKKNKYRLKNGVIIPIPGTSKSYSNHNLTDEIAAKLLKENTNRKSLFEVIPEQTDTGEQSVELFGNQLTIDEAKTAIEAIGLKTNATTAKGINKFVAKLSDEQKTQLEKLLTEPEPEPEPEPTDDNPDETETELVQSDQTENVNPEQTDTGE